MYLVNGSESDDTKVYMIACWHGMHGSGEEPAACEQEKANSFSVPRRRLCMAEAERPHLLELALAGADADLPPVVHLFMHAGRLLVLHVQVHIVLEGLDRQPLPIEEHLQNTCRSYLSL